METKVVEELKENAIYRMNESSRMIELALAKIEERDLWKQPNNQLNSIGNLLLHLCGNITQYAISSLGKTQDQRDRDKEFLSRNEGTKEELLLKLTTTVDSAIEIISNATLEELLRKREVQGFHFSGIGIIMHVVEHYSYHTGQIAFWVKQLKQQDLKFYADFDLNTKNE